MKQHDTVGDAFERERARMKGVAYRVLGSATEAEDAVQEAWLRFQSSDVGQIENIGGWLTTVVSRIALDALRSRKVRREHVLQHEIARTDVDQDTTANPEQEALLAEAVGIGLMVVLDRLEPAERLAFVLHDMFGVAFDDIAPILGRSVVAARQLASRARRRLHGVSHEEVPRSTEQRRLVEAFYSAARGGDYDALLRLLDPDVVLRVDGAASGSNEAHVARGAKIVAKRAQFGAGRQSSAELMLIDDEIGIAVAPFGHLRLVMSCRIVGDRITEIDVVADPRRLAEMQIALIRGQAS